MTSRPLAAEIGYPDPVCVVAGLAEAGATVFLDSALVSEERGRFSYLGVSPFALLESREGRVWVGGQARVGDPFRILETFLARHAIESREGLPPFQGGLAGYLGYELAHQLETLPGPARTTGYPDLRLAAYDVVVAWDHVAEKAWIVSTGLPAAEGAARRRRARDRMAWVSAALTRVGALPPVSGAPRLGTPPRSDFSREGYEASVRRVVSYIRAGDVFQVNLAQRFVAPLGEPPFELYRRLRTQNPAPFAAYVDLGRPIVASASPERFLCLHRGHVETRPIKGTRPRGDTAEADEARRTELERSEKDRAENVMIVDLLRNDLSRVCRDHSVSATELCVLESYPTVHHLVSTVVGEMREGLGAVDLLRAAFPGGSITGAPKIRAMEIIAELEPIERGPYCGSIGYLGFDGSLDSNIAIRTYVVDGDVVTFHAGGGIIADSDPAAEYEETLDKARALIRALGGDA